MVAEKVEICVSGSPGKLRGQQCHHADCACLAIDRHIGTIHVAPDLDHAKYDQQAENSSQGTQQGGGHAFEGAHPLALGKRHDGRKIPPAAK